MLDTQATYRLSRHVVILPADNGLVIEALICSRSFLISKESVLRLLIALTHPVRPLDLVASLEEPKRMAVLKFLETAYDSGLLTRIEPTGQAEEDAGSRAHWELHDLLFHKFSRIGSKDRRIGATYRFGQIDEEEPAIREGRERENLVPLRIPDMDLLKRCDIPLTAALETRRSQRLLESITVDELGEFLYRTCRITGAHEVNGAIDTVTKVYPSGGSLHPLEIYAIVSSCDGLPRGVYHYEAVAHALAAIREDGPRMQECVKDARLAAVLDKDPPVLLVIAARFRRTAWKYESIAYRLILSEVGALYQTMYLVATAMRLGTCALGSGNSDNFAQLVHTDYYRETSVGEIILGRPRDGTITGSDAQ